MEDIYLGLVVDVSELKIANQILRASTKFSVLTCSWRREAA